MNWRYLIITAALLPVAPAQAERDVAAERLQAADKLSDEGKPAECLKGVRRVIDGRDFAGYNKNFQSRSLYLAAICSFQAKDVPDARVYAKRATEIDGAPPYVWRLRAGLEMQNEADPAAAATGLEGMARINPEALNSLPIQWIFMYYNRVKKGKDAALRQRVLEVFAADSFQPNEIGTSNNAFRSELAIIRAGAGDKDGARALIAGITQPSMLLELSVDPRTRTLIPGNFDVRAATERELATRRDIAASHPASLAAVVEVANALRWLGRYEEALAGLEAASPEGPAGASFTDREEKRNWWWDAVGYANAYLGRYDAALSAFRHGIDAKESGGANVSQTINLANQQAVFGRHADAIKTLEPLGEGKGASPYGIMQLIAVRGCSRFNLGDKAGADADYAYAKAHDADAPSTVTDLALCRNDLDGAAAALVRRLNDPDLLVDALLTVSDFEPPPAAYPKQVEAERLEIVKARPEVKAAIEKAGGARRFNIRTAPF